MKSIKLGEEYSSVGYRFRFNDYETTDKWYQMTEDNHEFFDLIESSLDSYKVKDSEINPGDKIAGLYFRISEERY